MAISFSSYAGVPIAVLLLLKVSFGAQESVAVEA